MRIDLGQSRMPLFGLLLLASSCSSPAQQATIFVDESRIPAELRSDYESFATNCSKCHQLSRALNAHVTEPEHWDRYVARMMRTAGSAISPAEAPRILRFLHWYTASYSKRGGASGGEADPPLDVEVPAPSTQVAPAPVDTKQPAEPSPPPADLPPPPTQPSTEDANQTRVGEGQ